MSRFDVIIKNGTIIDGTGGPSFSADLAVKGDSIAAVEPGLNPEAADEVIDATGRAVSPGFIDPHSHDDFYLLTDPAAPAKVKQGVTTTVVGNCGFSTAPLVGPHGRMWIREMEFFGGDRIDPNEVDLSSLTGYFTALDKAGIGINAASMVGHCTLRACAMGLDRRPPREDELKAMIARADQAMSEGALGISSGLIYSPGAYAQTDELIAVTKPVADRGGLYCTHMRNEGDKVVESLQEALEIGRASGARVHIAHHKVCGEANWGRSVETIELMDRERQKGQAVSLDMYPYTAGSTYLASLLPPELLAQGMDALSARLNNPTGRKEVRAIMAEDAGEGDLRSGGFETILLTASPSRPDWPGRTLAQLAKDNNADPHDLLLDLVAADQTLAMMVLFMMDEADMARIMTSDMAMFGSDGIPAYGDSLFHPRFTGTFPRVLGRYARERKVLTMEEAIHRITDLPAQVFGFKDRGRVIKGAKADLVVFDPAEVIDKSTYDNPRQDPVGIDRVMVNGRWAVVDGELAGNRNGSVLTRTN